MWEFLEINQVNGISATKGPLGLHLLLPLQTLSSRIHQKFTLAMAPKNKFKEAFKKSCHSEALAGMAHWIECWPENHIVAILKVLGLI